MSADVLLEIWFAELWCGSGVPNFFKFIYTVPKYAFESPLVKVYEMCGSIARRRTVLLFFPSTQERSRIFPRLSRFSFRARAWFLHEAVRSS